MGPRHAFAYTRFHEEASHLPRHTPKHRAVELCEVCGERALGEPGSRGVLGMLCWVCYYDL